MSSWSVAIRRSLAGLTGFLNDAVQPLGAPKLRVLIALLVALATLTTVMIATDVSAHGKRLGSIFIATAVVRLVGLLLLQVAVLRQITSSERGLWKLDSAFWLHALTVPLGVALSVSFQKLLGADPHVFGSSLLANALLNSITTPLAPWVVAMAVAKPLAWRPAPWFRKWSLWLWPLLLWGAILGPLDAAHFFMNTWLLKGSGEWFWPIALLDGALSALLFLLTEGLNAAAYRRVADAAS